MARFGVKVRCGDAEGEKQTPATIDKGFKATPSLYRGGQ